MPTLIKPKKLQAVGWYRKLDIIRISMHSPEQHVRDEHPQQEFCPQTLQALPCDTPKQPDAGRQREGVDTECSEHDLSRSIVILVEDCVVGEPGIHLGRITHCRFVLQSGCRG